MRFYNEYMKSHQGFTNRLCHFIGFTIIVGVMIWDWRFFPLAVLFDLIISGFGHWLDGNTPVFFMGSKLKAIAGYILMNLAFIYEWWAELALGIFIGWQLVRMF